MLVQRKNSIIYVTKYHILILDKNLEENKIEICDLILGYMSYEDINVNRMILISILR